MTPDQTSETVKLTAELVSEHGGEIRLLEAVLLGLLDCFGSDPRVAEAVGQRVEEAYSQSLSGSTNDVAHLALDELRERIQSRLAARHGTI